MGTYTTWYNLYKPDLYESPGNPPATGWWQPFVSNFDIIDEQLQIAQSHRDAITSVQGVVISDGAGHFSSVLAEPIYFEKTPLAGRYYPLCSPRAVELSSGDVSANRVYLAPCVFPFNVANYPLLEVTLSVIVEEPVDCAGKVFIYSAHENFDYPDSLLCESPGFSLYQTGLISATCAINGRTAIYAGTRLWVGFCASEACSLRSIPSPYLWGWRGLDPSDGLSIGAGVERALQSWPTSLPTTWGYSESEVAFSPSFPAVFFSV